MVRSMKWMLLVVLLAMALPAPALAQAAAKRAGEISAQVPIDYLVRQRKTSETTKGMQINWGDTIKTERGGRVRVRLDDGSILNVGSQSHLTIEQHDSQSQRTALQLTYGRMRASVVRIAQPGGNFEVRTQAAVAGVVGTDLFTDSFQIGTTVIALGGGSVRVNPTAAQYAALITWLNPGEAVTMLVDQRPGDKRLATDEELNNAFQETSVDEVVQLSPRLAAPGGTLRTRITGKALAGATSITFEREGITALMSGPATAAQIPVSISVAANVPPGTYPFTVHRPQGTQVGLLVVSTEEDARRAAAQAGGGIQPPPGQTLTVIRGTKFELDASATRTPSGTSIVAYIWRILETRFSSDTAKFTINTSYLPPADYLIQLAVVNDRGQSATQRFNLTVLPGIQPPEILRDLATGYESLQPNQFLKNFDEEKFRNYSGFAASVEDSFRNQLEAVRVFQRPVNCVITEEQDQAVCQADFEIQFTKKDQPSEFLDQNGNPFPPGVPAPANATPGKRLLSGTERTTIRFERADKGWKIVDYNATVSCPGGTQVSGVNVGSCILAIGSFSTPNFQILNVQISGNDLFVGGTLTGSLDISPLGGFNGQVSFTGSGTVLGTSISGSFTPTSSASLGHVTFTISAPTVIPPGFTGADPFVFTITGTDSTGSLSQSTSLNLILKGDFTLSASPATSPTAPVSMPRGGTTSFTISVTPGPGFPSNGVVTLSIPNLPAGFTIPSPSINVTAGSSAVFAITATLSAPVGPITITVQGAFGGLVKTVDLNLGISPLPPFGLAQFTSPAAPLTLLANTSVVIGITATQNISGFTTPITLTLGPLPAGVTVSPTTATVNPGSTQPFTFTFAPVSNAFANFGVTNITVTGTAAGVPVQTTSIILNLSSASSLPFTLFASPASNTVVLTGSSQVQTSFNVFVSSQVTFNQPINISVGAPPPGITISPSNFVFTPGLSGSSVFYSVNVDPALVPPGSYPILISGVSGGVSATTTWTLNVHGAFSLSATPQNTLITPIVMPPDGTTQKTVTVTVTSINNFAGSVTVSFFSNVPFGSVVTVTPGATQTITVPAGGTANAVFTLVAALNTPSTGTFTASISASSPSGSAVNSISGPFLTIGPAGFSLSPTSTSTSLDINSTFGPTLSTSVQPLGAFGASVDFAVVTTSVPAGFTVSPLTQTIAAGAQARFTIRAATPAVVGNYSILVNATSPGQTAQTFTINVRARGSITLNVTQRPSGGPPGTQTFPLALAPGASLTFDVSVGGVNGFSGSTQVQVFGVPSGVTAAFTSSASTVASISAPGADILTLTNTSAVPARLVQLTVQASDPFNFLTNTNPNATIFLTIGSPSFVLGCSQFFGGPAVPCTSTNFVRLDINQPGSTGSETIALQLDSIGLYFGTVSVVPRNMPAGVTMSPNPVTLAPGQPVNVTFSAATPAVAGLFTFALDGTDTANPALTGTTNVRGQMNGSLKMVVTPSTSSTNPLIVQPGTSQTYTVDVSGQNGFSGTSQISFSPSFASGVSFAPAFTQTVSVPPTGTVTLTFTVTAAANAPPSFVQNVNFSADGFDAAGNNVTYFVFGESFLSGNYIVGPSSFSTSVTNPNTRQAPTLSNPQFVQVGQQTSLFVTITSIGAFNGTVFLDVLGLPSSISVSSAPGSSATIPVRQGPGYVVVQPQVAGVGVGTGGASATLFFTVAPNAPRGFVQGTLTATSGSLVQSVPIVFFVTPQVTLSLSPTASSTAPMVIAPGSSANLQITATASPSFSGDVDLSFNLPTGITVTPVSARVSLGGFVNVSVNLASGVTTGVPISFNITASINGNFVASTPVFIMPGSGAFGIAVTPSTALSSSTPLIIQPGSSGNVGVQINAIGVFSGSVTVTAGFSSLVSSSLSVATPSVTVSPGQTANFTVNAAAGAQGLIARMTISATGGNQSASAVVFVSIGSGGFSLSLAGGISSSNPLVGNLGNATSFTVLVHQQAGFAGTVNLVASNLPAGVTVRNNGFLVPAGTAQTFTMDIASTAAAGDTTFTVAGTSAGVPSFSLTVNLRIRGGFTLSLSAGAGPTNPVSIAPGANTNFTVAVNPVASFFGSVLITISTFNIPTGVTVTPTSATTTPGAPASFNVAVAAGTPASTVLTLFISASGTYASTFPSAKFFYTIATNPTFNMSFSSPLSVDIGNQFGSGLSVSLNPVGGFSGNVTVSVNTTQLPSGATVTPTSSTTPVSGFGTSVNLNFMAPTAVVSAGTFNVDITATSGSISITQTLQLELLANFNITLSAGTSSNAPVVLPATGSQNVNLTLTTSPPNIQCNGAPFSVALAVISTPPTGVTASISPSATVTTPGVLTVTTSAAPATQVFSVDGTATAPAGCAPSQGSGSVFFVVGPASFSINAPTFPTSVGINTNSLANVSVFVNSIGNFQGTVNIALVQASVPAGVTVTPATAAVAAGNSLNFQVRADSPATAGTASFNFTATDGTTTLTTTIPIRLQGSYTLTITPTNGFNQPAVVNPGQSLTYTVSVTPLNGFNGTVNIFQTCCGSPPPGVSVTGSFTATPTSPGQIVVTASATAAASTPQGVNFFSNSSDSFSGASFSFFSAVGPASFRVSNFTSVNFPQQLVNGGLPQSVNVFVQSLGGFSGTVDLALASLAPGISASPQNGQVTVPAGSSASFTVAIQAATSVNQGPLDIMITATRGTTTVNTFIYLYVASNMALVQSPPSTSGSPLRLLNGDPLGQTVNVQVLNQGGFTGSITLSATSVPVGMTVTPSSTLVAANGTAGFQITAQTASPGLQAVTISARFSGLSAVTTIFFNVGVGSYLMSSTPASSSTNPIALDPNGTTIVPIAVTITPQNGFVGTVDITPSALPGGVTINPATAQVVITSSSPGTATFNFSATAAQGLTPITVTFNGLAVVATPIGPTNVAGSASSFLLVNPPTFGLTQTAGTSTSPIKIEQGIPPGQTFQVGVTGTGTVTLSFANVPAGVNITPPTANVTAGSSASFNIDAAASTAIGSYTIAILGTSGLQTISASLFVNVVTPTTGFFLTSSPPTSSAAPVILQPDHSLITFININVNAKGTFAGIVNLSLTGVPTGVTATLTPSTADLSATPLQTLQLQFQTTTGLAPFAPTIVSVDGTSAALTGSAPIFVALQVTSAIQVPGSGGLRLPQIIQVSPPTAFPGSHSRVLLSGSSLSGVSAVMSSSPHVAAQIEPGGTDTELHLEIFVRPNAEDGVYTLMLVTPHGSVPVRFVVVAHEPDVSDVSGREGRGALRRGPVRSGTAPRLVGGDVVSSQDSRAVITGVEPASLKPGQVVEGRLLGENLAGVRAVHVQGLGVSVELIEAQPDQVRVRFIVAQAAASGSRMLTVNSGSQTLTSTLQIEAARVAVPARASNPAGARPAAGDAGVAAAAPAPPDLVVRASDITMSPAIPRVGDTVSFRVQMANRGGQKAESVEVEFSLSGANVRMREQFDFDASATQTFHVEWQAAGSGRFEPRVVIDPDRRLNLANRATTVAAMPAFEILSAPGGARGVPVIRERGQLSLAASGCQGFRFSSGTESACNGGADIEVRVAPQGGALRVEADGVRNLGSLPLEQVGQVPVGAMPTSAMIQPGAVYLVQTRRGNYLVRVMDVRGISAVRSAPPPAMNRPRLGEFDRGAAAATASNITLVLEWRMANQQ